MPFGLYGGRDGEDFVGANRLLDKGLRGAGFKPEMEIESMLPVIIDFRSQPATFRLRV